MEKNVIELKMSEDGTSLNFVDETGKNSTTLHSKEAGFKKITALAQENKITVEQFTTMRETILSAEKLPWAEPEKHDLIDDLFTLSLLSSLLDGLPGNDIFGRNPFIRTSRVPSLDVIGTVLTENILDDCYEIEKPVKVATLVLCKNCGAHGRIYTKNGYATSTIVSKSQAVQYLEMMRKEFINEEEYEKVKKEIESSQLLD